MLSEGEGFDILSDKIVYAEKGAKQTFDVKVHDVYKFFSINTGTYDNGKIIIDQVLYGMTIKLSTRKIQYTQTPHIFIDANYHLNDSGVIYRTAQLISDLKRALDITTKTLIEIPKGGGAAPDTDKESDDVVEEIYLSYIKLEETVNNKITITGLTELGKAQPVIKIPSKIVDKMVCKILEAAFVENPSLVKVEFPSTIEVFDNKLFSNNAHLQNIVLHTNSKPLPSVGNGFLFGASKSVKKHVKKTLFGDFYTDYYWAAYASSIVSI